MSVAEDVRELEDLQPYIVQVQSEWDLDDTDDDRMERLRRSVNGNLNAVEQHVVFTRARETDAAKLDRLRPLIVTLVSEWHPDDDDDKRLKRLARDLPDAGERELVLARAKAKVRERDKANTEAAQAGLDAEHEARLANRKVEAGTTDMANGRRLVLAHGSELRYVDGLGWFAWDGQRWAPDSLGEVMRRAKSTALGINHEVAHETDDGRRDALRKHARHSEGLAQLRNMITLAESELEVVARVDAFDSDAWALNVANGIVDLKTGELRPHDPAELHSQIAGAAYVAGATAPLWGTFLERILPDPDVRAFVQRMAGYSMTGDVSAQVLPFLYGSGQNGKTTLLEVLRAVLGDYGYQAGSDLLVSKRERGAGEQAAVAKLRGRRFVTTVEVDEGKQMAEGLVKELTGERTINAKLMRQNPFEFVNRSKVWLAANHKPEVRGQDWAIWRRILLVPFEVQITEAEKDPALAGKLLAEREGILAWLVAGCLAYQAEGLKPPGGVSRATKDYRDESNPLRDWIEACCEDDPAAEERFSDLRASYMDWARLERVAMPLKPRRFGDALKAAGYLPDSGAANVKTRRGIRLTNGGGPC
jgi:putative DNA primase/helicase